MAILWTLPRLARDRSFNATSLAEVTGLPLTLVEGWLQQRLMPPLTAHELDRLCQALNCQPGDLLVAEAPETVLACEGEQTCLDSLLDAKLHIFHEEMNEHLTRMQMQVSEEAIAHGDPVPSSS